MTTHKRRLQARGSWMELISPAILRAHMEHRGITQSRLAEFTDCSRQFIYQLLNGQRKSCTPKLALAIEEVLNVPKGAIFVDKKSPDVGRIAPARRSSAGRHAKAA